MKFTTGACLGMMTWARVFRYGYVWWKLISQFREDGNSLVLKLATPAVVMLSLFNVALMADCIQKFLKYRRKSVDPPQKERAEMRGAVLLGASNHQHHKKW